MFAYNRPTHFTAFRLLRRSLTIEMRTQKSVELKLIKSN